MNRQLRIAIVGGGIGGVALAASLKKFGFSAHIFERAPAFGEVGAGIQMTPNAVKVIRELGLLPELSSCGFLPEALVGRNWRTAKPMFRMPLKDDCPRLYNAPFFHVHRADLHNLLVAQLEPEQASFGKRCVSVAHSGSGAVVSFEDGSHYEADLVVGADGIHSAIRESLFGPQTARFTGHMCWRAVVPCDGLLPYVSPDSSFWMGPDAHVVTYYVRGGKGVNIVAVRETTDWVGESWNIPSSREELQAAFGGWHGNIQKLFTGVTQTFKWGLFDRDPMPSWSAGAVTLLGDAAHPMLPFLSQGAAMAIEDGFVLAKSLVQQPGLAAALQAYEAERRPRTARVQLESRERGRTYHLATPFQQLRRDVTYRLRNLINPHAGGIKANWVYEYDATAGLTPMAA